MPVELSASLRISDPVSAGRSRTSYPGKYCRTTRLANLARLWQRFRSASANLGIGLAALAIHCPRATPSSCCPGLRGYYPQTPVMGPRDSTWARPGGPWDDIQKRSHPITPHSTKEQNTTDL